MFAEDPDSVLVKEVVPEEVSIDFVVTPYSAAVPLISAACEENIPNDNNEIYIAVEKSAEFPGGIQAIYRWLYNRCDYSEAALPGDSKALDTLHVKFIVEKDGSTGSVTMIKGVQKEINHEVLRLIKMMPKWERAKMETNLFVLFSLPIKIKLN